MIRFQVEGKGLLGFAPELPPHLVSRMGASDQTVKMVKRRLYHAFIQEVLGSFERHVSDGMLLLINGAIRLFIPAFSVGIADHPEGQLLCTSYEAGNCQRPCRVCRTHRSLLHEWDLWEGPRLLEETRALVTNLLDEGNLRNTGHRGPWETRDGIPKPPPRTKKEIKADATAESVHLQEVESLLQ